MSRKQAIFDSYRKYQDNLKSLNVADNWFKTTKHEPESITWKEAERRLNLLIKETAELFLIVYG